MKAENSVTSSVSLSKVAILSLGKLDKIDLQMIQTPERRFVLPYEHEEKILEAVSDKLHEIGLAPGIVYVEKEGVIYVCNTVVLRACYTKGRISEAECAEMIFRPENIINERK